MTSTARSFRVPRLRSRTRSLLILSTDALIATASLLGAYLLRFEAAVPEREWEVLPPVITMLIVSRIAANFYFRLNRWSFRYSGLTDAARVALAGFSGTGLWALGLYLLRLHMVPRAVLVMELLLSTALMGMVRFGPRLLWMYRADLLRARRFHAVRTVIVGAGASGEALLRDLQRSPNHDHLVLGFVDDDPILWGDVVGGKSVLGSVSDLPSLVPRLDVQAVVIAIPKLSARRIREILSLCSTLKLRFKILPPTYRNLPSSRAPRTLQDLTPGDLLEREEVAFSHDGSVDFGAERPQIVAGAAGSIGGELCLQLLTLGCRHLVMLDINESGLYLLKRRLERDFPDRWISAELADIRDAGRLRELFTRYRPRDVFHAAACKHVPLMESCPGEAVKTNILGTRLLAHVAEEAHVERFVFMSTDKAVRPASVMGATKRLGELIVRRMDEKSPVRFSVVRFGNVLDSAGSVVPIFREQIRAGGPVTVTHPDARRYFMTISEAVGLVLRAAYGDYGQLCVLEMGEPIRILDLARHMITMSGLVPEVDIKIELSGLRPGEKLQEELFGASETRLRRIDRKVWVVEGPPPPEDLDAILSSLENDATREDAEALIRQLRTAVGDDRDLRLDASSEPSLTL